MSTTTIDTTETSEIGAARCSRTLMLKLLLDQDFDHRIIRALRKRIPELDCTTAYALD